MYIEKVDKEVAEILRMEEEFQKSKINLIASENYASRAVREAQGSVMTNKYAEGYPGKRYYGGCEYYDMVERLAIERAKKLFGAEHVNVQPHSGSQANIAVYFSVLKPGDKIMSMELPHGGHLSHGSPVNISGKWFKIIPYGVDKETKLLDYDQLMKIAKENQPDMIVCGASAYPRIIDFKAFREIADEVGAYLMADIAHIAGLVVAGLHPSPIKYADFVTTTTHKTLRGPRGGMIMCKEELAKKVDRSVFPGLQGGPLMHAIAAKAVAFAEAMRPEFNEYQKQIVKNAKYLAEKLAENGFDIITGGTDNHLMLVDLRNKGINGKEAEDVLQSVEIILNRSTIPFDPAPPFRPSGVRIGTPPVTTRGMKEGEMEQIADLITRTIENRDNPEALKKIKSEVEELTSSFPLFAGEE